MYFIRMDKFRNTGLSKTIRVSIGFQEWEQLNNTGSKMSLSISVCCDL